MRSMLKRLLFSVFLLSVSTVGIYLILTLTPYYTYTLYTLAGRVIRSPDIATKVQNIIRPYLPVTTSAELFTKINQYRTASNLNLIKTDTADCPTSEQLGTQTLSLCPGCTHASLMTISKYASPNQLLDRLIAEPAASKILQNPKTSYVCIQDQIDQLNLLFFQKTAATTASLSAPAKIQTAPTATPTHFSEDDLWTALMTYRQDHREPVLNRNDNICTYARKRVQDQINMMQDKSPDEYPNQEKYPLDAHQGFSADAASGYAFDVTHMTELAENLAYWPDVQSPVHLIEWGWDSSTEGHRETQLSGNWTDACITGDQGFYVAIFGK